MCHSGDHKMQNAWFTHVVTAFFYLLPHTQDRIKRNTTLIRISNKGFCCTLSQPFYCVDNFAILTILIKRYESIICKMYLQPQYYFSFSNPNYRRLTKSELQAVVVFFGGRGRVWWIH